MKYLLFVFLACLLAIPTFASDPNVVAERGVLFQPILQNNDLQQKLKASAKPMGVNFNYASLLDRDTDILLVGEAHNDPIPSRDVNFMIKDLKQRVGLNYIASEFLLQSEQPLLNKYAQNKIDYETLKRGCYHQERVFVAVVARRYGVTVVGLDLPVAKSNPRQAMSIEGLTERNKAWVDILVDIKQQNPRAKILVHGGSFHTQTFSQYFPTVPTLLQEEGFKTKTLEITGPFDPLWKQLHLNTNTDLLFTIPPELKKYIQADYVIYVPRVDYTREDQARLEKLIQKSSKGGTEDWDGILNDPDRESCQISTNCSRVK